MIPTAMDGMTLIPADRQLTGAEIELVTLGARGTAAPAARLGAR
jgi:hypothetical protein